MMPPIRALAALALSAVLACPALAADADLRALALDQVNQSRAEHDLPALTLTEPLNEAARAHATDMADQGYFAHRAPGGGTALERYLEAGGTEAKMVAENIGRCAGCGPEPTAEHVRSFHRDWMDSPSHRRNILHPGVRRFGYVLVPDDDRDGLVAVQTFAGPGVAVPADADAAAPVTPEEAARLALERINTARREKGVEPLTLASDLSAAVADQVPDDLSGFKPSSLEAPRVGSSMGGGRVFLAVGRCGGCGTQVTAADIDRFVGHWLDAPEYGGPLLDEQYETLGFTLKADGSGRKVAVAAVAGG
ncbi:CAP domain-containing protein [Caenispirillum salinarum]|uniref:CAP domain-containing protein n=1 Tax=Caenispirillum salinarum TaxID=859058 RepID=UPI00384B7A3B